ncbi:MAG: molybdate ABC transporter substrate-binding protein [Eubacteriales bacterium]|nr:molybdate ABC transporter substrate-binding protein [Eubacteriales bacterium]
MKKLLAVLLSISFLLLGCTAVAETAENVELVVFGAASMTEALTQIGAMYEAETPGVKLIFNFDSSGTLKTQIEEGAEADVFISAGQKQMNQLDSAVAAEQNPNGLDFVMQGTRFDLLTNTIVMIVPEGSDKGITSFEDAATDKVSLIALGNSDVPVGQYAQDVYEYLGLWDQLNSEGKITFGTNVKEVLSQVETAAVDCGVVYISDAATGTGITVVVTAPEGSHKPVNYPAAVLKNTKHEAEAKAFLEYLKGDEASKVLTDIGFQVPER